MHIAVCDDEEHCLEAMRQLLQDYPGISRVVYYRNLEELSEAQKNGTAFDLIFMDIEWNGNTENGIEYASQYNRRSPQTQFVFVTAYNDKFSQRIFWEKLNLCGYLVKPVQKENLKILLDKVREKLFGSEALVLQHGGTTEKIPSNQIYYLESNAHQVVIHTLSGEISVYEKLDAYEKKLSKDFVRIHKSFLVNMQYIRRIEMKEVTLQDDTVLPVSRTRYSASRDKYFRFMRAML